MQEQEKKEEHGHDEDELVAEPVPESGNPPETQMSTTATIRRTTVIPASAG